MSVISKLLGQPKADEESAERPSVRSSHEISKEDIDEWPPEASTLIYCELCEQVFVSGDVFYDHRMASTDERARKLSPEDGFEDRRELTAGDEFPDEATVGEVTPCEPNKLEGE